jgi:hypothetical protein
VQYQKATLSFNRNIQREKRQDPDTSYIRPINECPSSIPSLNDVCPNGMAYWNGCDKLADYLLNYIKIMVSEPSK